MRKKISSNFQVELHRWPDSRQCWHNTWPTFGSKPLLVEFVDGIPILSIEAVKVTLHEVIKIEAGKYVSNRSQHVINFYFSTPISDFCEINKPHVRLWIVGEQRV